jgi:hypothetical protein
LYKKVSHFILSAALILTFASCGKDNTATGKKDDNSNITTANLQVQMSGLSKEPLSEGE